MTVSDRFLAPAGGSLLRQEPTTTRSGTFLRLVGRDTHVRGLVMTVNPVVRALKEKGLGVGHISVDTYGD